MLPLESQETIASNDGDGLNAASPSPNDGDIVGPDSDPSKNNSAVASVVDDIVATPGSIAEAQPRVEETTASEATGGGEVRQTDQVTAGEAKASEAGTGEHKLGQHIDDNADNENEDKKLDCDDDDDDNDDNDDDQPGPELVPSALVDELEAELEPESKPLPEPEPVPMPELWPQATGKGDIAGLSSSSSSSSSEGGGGGYDGAGGRGHRGRRRSRPLKRPWYDRRIVLAAVSRCGMALEHASFYLRCDREVVKAAVAQNQAAIRFCADESVRAQLDVGFAACLRRARQHGLHEPMSINKHVW